LTVKGFLLRFFLSYFVLLVVAGLTLSHFGIKGGSWVNTGILIGLVYWGCMSFGQKNGRYFTKNEKIVIVLGVIAIDLLLQFVFSVAAVSALKAGTGAGPLIFALGFVGLLHALLIYYFVGLCEKHLTKTNIING
jgi:hypothetical protein